MPRKLYPVIIHKDPDSDFGASFVDFPATCGGATVEETLSEAEALLAEVVADYLSKGRALPQATPIADIDPESREGAALLSLVPVQTPGKARKLSVTLDEDLIAAIDAVAANRSAFLAEAARARLGHG